MTHKTIEMVNRTIEDSSYTLKMNRRIFEEDSFNL